MMISIACTSLIWFPLGGLQIYRFKLASGVPNLHPEDTKLGGRDWSVERGTNTKAEHRPRVSRVNHTVIPQPTEEMIV